MVEREREREHERFFGRPERGPYDYGWASESSSRYDRYRHPSERDWRGEPRETPDQWSEDYDRWNEWSGAPRLGWNEPASRSARPYGYGGEPFSSTYRDYGSLYGRHPAAGERDERWRAGGFAGRGPKGYQRSDARIHEDVCDRLTEAPDIDASHIEVTVNDGEVTLSGSVDEREDKRRSEDLIENISGVRDVHNNLRVNRSRDGSSGPVSTIGPAAARR